MDSTGKHGDTIRPSTEGDWKSVFDEAMGRIELSSATSSSLDNALASTEGQLGQLFADAGIYLVEARGDEWVLRRSVTDYVMEVGATAEEVKAKALQRLLGWAPCTLRVISNVPEEWRLATLGGDWQRVPW